MASNNGKKSSFLRTLWIPGSRRTHPKGRYATTSKQVSYTTRPKKSEIWSLGGSKMQRDLLQAEAGTVLLDGPSNSALAAVTYVGATVGVVAANAASNDKAEVSNTSLLTAETPSDIVDSGHSRTTSPTSPNSTASTAPLVSPITLNPLDEALSRTEAINGTNFVKMPAKHHSPIPVVVTATTTAEVINVDRFPLLNHEQINIKEFDVFSLPSLPRTIFNGTNGNTNNSGTTSSVGTFAHVNTTSSSVDKIVAYQKTTTLDKIQGQQYLYNHPHAHPHSHSNNNYSPRIHNNNQGDVNSIESINDDNDADDNDPVSAKLYTINTLPQKAKQSMKYDQQTEQEHIKQDQQQRQHEQHKAELVVLPKSKRKRKKKCGYTKELDQLDGVPPKNNLNDNYKDDDDEKMVKCLYYTLMCCDCTIS